MSFSVTSFSGMDNITPGVRGSIAHPLSIIDALVDGTGELSVRGGSSKVASLTGCKNLWRSPGTGYTYCTDAGYLYTWNGASFTVVRTISGEGKVYFANIDKIDYCGNKHWLAAIDRGIAKVWGESANNMQNMNWQSSENGSVLFLRDSFGEETVIPHPGELVHAPLPFDCITAAHGRIWGVRGNKVIYSYPLVYDWFEDVTNNIDFLNETTMIAPTSAGLFVGTTKEVYFFQGTSPEESIGRIVSSSGALKDSLVISKSFLEFPDNTPVWMEANGNIVAGTIDGQIVPLTKNRVQINSPAECSAGQVTINGTQIILQRVGV